MLLFNQKRGFEGLLKEKFIGILSYNFVNPGYTAMLKIAPVWTGTVGTAKMVDSAWEIEALICSEKSLIKASTYFSSTISLINSCEGVCFAVVRW